MCDNILSGNKMSNKGKKKIQLSNESTKLDKLNKKIQHYKKKHAPKTYKKENFLYSSFGFALEIVAAVAVGLLVGFYLDKFFNFKFVFKISCLMLAFIASLVNIYRATSKK
ncbi:MAG: AtpZ/AtpI family protein [Rickettsiales bacterium]|nr:AtpZ/AtpI family protein [Rickettsiales bacterium]